MLAAGVLLPPGSAGAAGGGKRRAEIARKHDTKGNALYQLERYAAALAEYEQGFVAKSDPSFLFKIAQCHRLMGHGAEAIRFYRRYLGEPGIPNRAVAEKHIADLEAAAAAEARPAAVTPPAPASAPAPASSSARPAEAAPAPAASVESSAPPPAAATGSHAAAPAAAATAAAAPAAPQRPQALDLDVGVYVYRRDLSYDDVTGPVTPYRLAVAPSMIAAIDWFPAALVTAGPAAHIGVTGSIGYTFAAGIKLDGATFPNRQWSYLGGLKGRLPLGPVTLWASAGYGADSFQIASSTDGAPKPPIPDVGYRFWRFGGGLLAPIAGPVTARLAGGYRYVVATGEISDPSYFADTTAGGFDLAATMGVTLARGIELRLTADVRRYVLVPASSATGAANAARVVDQYLGAVISVAMLLGGPDGM